MPYRVVQWATGGVGMDSLRQVIEHPDLELVGLFVYSDEKNGKDAGELAGLPPVGVRATTDRAAILALDADCVLHMPRMIGENPGDTSVATQNDADVEALLRSGKNVVSLAGYIYPAVRGTDFVKQLTEACEAGGSTMFGTGINPGFFLDRMGPALSGACARASSLHLTELWDANTYPSEMIVSQWLGFGQPEGWLTQDAPSGELMAAYFSETLRSTALTMGREVESFERELEIAYATRDVELNASGVKIAKGTIGAIAWTWSGMVDGKPFVSINDRWVGDYEIPTWESGSPMHTSHNQWDLRVEGHPTITASFKIHELEGVDALMPSTAATAVNSVAPICEAPPGIFPLPAFALCLRP